MSKTSFLALAALLFAPLDSLHAAKSKGVKFLRMENNAAVYAVGSGTYRFQSTLP